MKCREFFPLCPFFRVRARDGKERKVANKAPRSRPPHRGATSARAPRLSCSSHRAPRPLHPRRRLSLSLKPEAAEHDRVRGRQAEGKDEQRPFVRSNTTALHTSAPPAARRARRLCLWHGSALIRCGSLLTNCSGTILPACTE